MDICASVESSLGGHSSATGFLLIFVSRPLSYMAFQAGRAVCTIVGDAPVFVEVGEAGIAVDHAMRRELAVQCS
jgi:hypothetical protein